MAEVDPALLRIPVTCVAVQDDVELARFLVVLEPVFRIADVLASVQEEVAHRLKDIKSPSVALGIVQPDVEQPTMLSEIVPDFPTASLFHTNKTVLRAIVSVAPKKKTPQLGGKKLEFRRLLTGFAHGVNKGKQIFPTSDGEFKEFLTQADVLYKVAFKQDASDEVLEKIQSIAEEGEYDLADPDTVKVLRERIAELCNSVFPDVARKVRATDPRKSGAEKADDDHEGGGAEEEDEEEAHTIVEEPAPKKHKSEKPPKPAFAASPIAEEPKKVKADKSSAKVATTPQHLGHKSDVSKLAPVALDAEPVATKKAKPVEKVGAPKPAAAAAAQVPSVKALQPTAKPAKTVTGETPKQVVAAKAEAPKSAKPAAPPAKPQAPTAAASAAPAGKSPALKPAPKPAPTKDLETTSSDDSSDSDQDTPLNKVVFQKPVAAAAAAAAQESDDEDEDDDDDDKPITQSQSTVGSTKKFANVYSESGKPAKKKVV